jgi:pentatricopeptide repeat protein
MLYSIFLQACASQGEAELALSAIHAMKLRGLCISGACHLAAIAALCRADAVQVGPHVKLPKRWQK